MTPRPDTLAQVKQIIRTDLKLAPDQPVPDDMPLVGGDLDLDSLDVLLLLTSLEKRFGIKVSSKSVGRAIFENVATLAAYIDEHQSACKADGSEAEENLDAALSNLPHGEGFRFLTHLTDLRPGEAGAATWNLKGDEPFFAGHFPSGPVVPGVLIAEALAQLSGLITAPGGAGRIEGRLAHVDLRYRQTVTPPVEIELRSRQAKAMGELHQFDTEARVAGQVVAEGSLALHVAAGEGP